MSSLAFIASVNCLAYFGQFRLFCCELKHFFAYVLKAQIVQWCSKANVRYAESKVELLQASNHLPERGEGKRQMLRIISSVKNTQISGWECSRGEPHHFLDATCRVSSSGGILIVFLMTLWSLWPNMIECTSWQIFHSFSFKRRNWFCPNSEVTHPGVVTFCQWFFKFTGGKLLRRGLFSMSVWKPYCKS